MDISDILNFGQPGFWDQNYIIYPVINSITKNLMKSTNNLRILKLNVNRISKECNSEKKESLKFNHTDDDTLEMVYP